jgi:hypothetical protein
MRSFRAVGGCVDVTGLEPGEQRVTEVQVADTPVDAASMNLAMELALTPNGAAWQPVLHEARDLFLDALFAPNRTQASTLLGAMR